MESIYHEKQDGSLCAQHCLNNLLQGSYYTAVDLAEISQNLDDMELSCMAAAGISTEDFKKFMQQPSENMDDSGMFSIQVIVKALESFSLSLINLESEDTEARQAKSNPQEFVAFICNYQSHWITIRKLGHQWFNLNSLLTFPELISDLHLSMYLTQLSLEGYTNFLVRGILPECEANQMLQFIHITQPIKPDLLTPPDEDNTSGDTSHQLSAAGSSQVSGGQQRDQQQIEIDEEEELQAAIALSLAASASAASNNTAQSHLQSNTNTNTTAASQSGAGTSSASNQSGSSTTVLTPEQLREKRLKRFDPR